MKPNAEWIVQYHSVNDHLVPVEEGRKVAENLGMDYIELPDEGHFQDDAYPQFVAKIKSKLA
jgi:predicted alpha/beta hydrolase family esterase